MATPDQLARQVQREIESKKEAEHRLVTRTREAEEKDYASSTVYGNTMINGALEAVSTEIGKSLHRITQGWSAPNADAAAYVKHLDPDLLALISLKVMLDVACSNDPMSRYTPSQLFYSSLTSRIGSRVGDEVMLQRFKDAFPKEFDSVILHAHKGYKYKVAKYRAMMRQLDHQAQAWNMTIKHLVGAWLLDRIAHATGWISRRTIVTGKTVKGKLKQQAIIVSLSEGFWEAREGLMDRARELATINWPMLCPPSPWSDEHRGGYLIENVRRRCDLVRQAKRRHVSPSGKGKGLNGTRALAMLNRLQEVAYQVNPFVLEVANACMERRLTIGKFKASDPLPPPPKPQDWETAPVEEKLEYRRARTRIEDENAALHQNNYRTAESLWIANKYRDEESFWIPWSFDFRGRLYPLPVMGLNPQGTDPEKAMILFAEAGPVNEKWLAFHIATTAGLDKSTMQERLEWTAAHHDVITAVATEPLSNLELWANRSEPWCFLAACREFWECVITSRKQVSNLPVGIDATCSGLQHLSALTLDRQAAEMVNVVPTERPTDAYAIVAEAAKKHLPEAYHPLITRKVTKRTVMTTPYGVTIDSARGYIRDELPKELPDGTPIELSAVVKAVFKEAIPEVIPGPIKAMRYIQQAAADAIKAGTEALVWKTPSGFTVVQDDRRYETKQIQTKLLGKRLVAVVGQEGRLPAKPVDALRGAAPNLVHSLDAALIHMTFDTYEKPFTVIHDCVLARSCDVEEIGHRIRDNFVQIYSKPVLEDWAKQIGVPFDPDVMLNTLDINLVQDSAYLFC